MKRGFFLCFWRIKLDWSHGSYTCQCDVCVRKLLLDAPFNGQKKKKNCKIHIKWKRLPLSKKKRNVLFILNWNEWDGGGGDAFHRQGGEYRDKYNPPRSKALLWLHTHIWVLETDRQCKKNGNLSFFLHAPRPSSRNTLPLDEDVKTMAKKRNHRSKNIINKNYSTFWEKNASFNNMKEKKKEKKGRRLQSFVLFSFDTKNDPLLVSGTLSLNPM